MTGRVWTVAACVSGQRGAVMRVSSLAYAHSHTTCEPSLQRRKRRLRRRESSQSQQGKLSLAMVTQQTQVMRQREPQLSGQLTTAKRVRAHEGSL